MHTSSSMRTSRRMHRSRSPLAMNRPVSNELFYQSNSKEFYTTIAVKNLSPNLSDIDVQKLCYKKFSRYGSISIKIYNRGYDRVAFIHFTNCENARKARHAKSDLVWDNVLVILEPVYHHGTYPPSELVRYPPSPSRMHYHPPSKHESRRNYPPFIPYSSDAFGYNRNQSSERHRSSSSSAHRNHADFESNIQQEPTRTLNIENLAKDMTQSKLQEIFGRFGNIQEIDLKKSSSKRYSATIRYENMDMACEARRVMNGESIAKSPIEIKYDHRTN